MSERYTTARIPFARARGASSAMSGTYDGAELAHRSSRPGAYDAVQLPSLMNGRRRAPGEVPSEAPIASATPAPSMRAPVVITREAPELPPPPLPELATPELESELEARKAALAAWQSYVSALQARLAFDALASSLRPPFIPPESMPAF